MIVAEAVYACFSKEGHRETRTQAHKAPADPDLFPERLTMFQWLQMGFYYVFTLPSSYTATILNQSGLA